MEIDPIWILFTGLHSSIPGGIYGWFIAIVWLPFLLARRFRVLFDSLPPSDWRVSYVLWMVLPAMVWAFFFGSVLSLSRDVRPPTRASELYVSGMDGIIVATVVSIFLWPTLLLYVLPARGFDWYSEKNTSTTVALVVGATVWYLLWIVVPMYVFVFFAGFGDAMTGT